METRSFIKRVHLFAGEIKLFPKVCKTEITNLTSYVNPKFPLTVFSSALAKDKVKGVIKKQAQQQLYELRNEVGRVGRLEGLRLPLRHQGRSVMTSGINFEVSSTTVTFLKCCFWVTTIFRDILGRCSQLTNNSIN